MELGNVVEFLEKKTILVTGGTGFLAKILVEKILRVQPNIGKLYLLIRAPGANAVSERLQNEVIEKELFRVLRQKHGANWRMFIHDKVIPVAGDITLENLGVQDSNLLEEMSKNVDIIINLAATTNFDERYDVALNLNTFGARNLMNFARKCEKIMLFLQVSTAYVSGEKAGLILEDPYKFGEALNGISGLDIDHEAVVMEAKLSELRASEETEKDTRIAMKNLGMQRAKKHGWPNPYVFTKAMGEMVLDHMKEDVPLVILRPTIVTSTFKEPFPGWVEGLRTIDSLVLGYAQGKIKCFLGDPESILDVIPADLVVNAMITAMSAHANFKSKSFETETTIYQIGSSIANPMKLSVLQNCGLRYFTKHPWIDKNGKAVKVGKVTVLSSMASFNRYMAIKYLLPLKVLELANTALCQNLQGYYLDLHRKINFVMRLIDLYQPYLFFKGIYDDMNTEKLRVATRMSSVETDDVFYFDPRIISWEDYFMGTHFPGIVKHVFK